LVKKNLITADVISALSMEPELIKSWIFGVTTFNWRETADVGDIVRTIIVDSTVTARMKRSKVIDATIGGDGCRFGFFLLPLLMKKSYNGVEGD
jgi:phosphoribosylformylglycinamidine cyclo-ligase